MVKWWNEKDLFLTSDIIYWRLLNLHNEFIEEQRRNLDWDFSYWDKFKDYVDNNSSIIIESDEFKEAMKWIIEDENDFENKVREEQE